jgi:hypothetical protein
VTGVTTIWKPQQEQPSLSQLGEPSCPALSKAACFAEGKSIFEHDGHIGAATHAIIREHSSNDAANLRKRAFRLLIVPALYLDSPHPAPCSRDSRFFEAARIDRIGIHSVCVGS